MINWCILGSCYSLSGPSGPNSSHFLKDRREVCNNHKKNTWEQINVVYASGKVTREN